MFPKMLHLVWRGVFTMGNITRPQTVTFHGLNLQEISAQIHSYVEEKAKNNWEIKENEILTFGEE